MLIFNLYTLDHCCHRKHSSFKTFLTFFLLPINYLYKYHVLVLLVLMCSIWVYTSEVLSLSIQAAGLMESASPLFIDLDKLKQINDQYGHLTGDLYLNHFSNIASRIFHENGTVYRFGGGILFCRPPHPTA